MTERRLTARMVRTLEALKAGERSSYPGLNLITLYALEARELVKARRGLGSMAMPHNAIMFSLTQAGREALDMIEHKTFPSLAQAVEWLREHGYKRHMAGVWTAGSYKAKIATIPNTEKVRLDFTLKKGK